jgi:hypothetical protein
MAEGSAAEPSVLMATCAFKIVVINKTKVRIVSFFIVILFKFYSKLLPEKGIINHHLEFG